MDKKNVVTATIAIAAVVVGGWMVVRNLGSGGPTKADLESVMHNLSTEDLIYRRQFMHSQITQAKAGGSGPRPDLLASAEASLLELDTLLRERGIDPDTLGQAKSGNAGAPRDERP
ncbi:hypothetical protein [Nodularia spumigena]|jgi:hypothetical protein|uniref:hypothetical protein n=1 Tax=Nodularia spumigena TaxID=70799 RepID=UPI002B21CB90|nr:hypothetical protein [Nodularia spumigena]MEA5614867.1 hypothetical protein [Nodularia spumigena UHCC 0040]